MQRITSSPLGAKGSPQKVCEEVQWPELLDAEQQLLTAWKLYRKLQVIALSYILPLLPLRKTCQDVNGNHVSGSLNIFYFMKILHMFFTALLSHGGPLAWMLQMGPHTWTTSLSLHTFLTVSEHARHFQPLGFLFSLSSAKHSSLLSAWCSFPSLAANFWLRCCPSPQAGPTALSPVPTPVTGSPYSSSLLGLQPFVHHSNGFQEPIAAISLYPSGMSWVITMLTC